jgi:transposase
MERSDRIQRGRNDLAVTMSIPGMGFISATTILAEIGDHTNFKNPEKLAAWCGLFLLYINLPKRSSRCNNQTSSKHI